MSSEHNKSFSLRRRDGTDHLVVDIEGTPGTSLSDALAPIFDHPAVGDIDTQ